MRWLAKAALQTVFSYTPGGERLNYLVQRRVARTLPLRADSFHQKAARALDHFDAFRTFGRAEPADAVFYEFGAGWDLIVPLTYYALGIERQTLVDINPLIRLELVEASLRTFAAERPKLEAAAKTTLRPLGEPSIGSVAELRERFGIEYLAPRDPGATELPAGSFDFVSSTDTLEHIPEHDLRRVLAECRRLLKPHGVLSSRADLEDHYAHFDRSLPALNFLKCGDALWRTVNPPLHYQSRLRYPDYLRLLRESGFEIVQERISRVSETELARLRAMRLADRFRGYSVDELAVKGLTFVARVPRP